MKRQNEGRNPYWRRKSNSKVKQSQERGQKTEETVEFAVVTVESESSKLSAAQQSNDSPEALCNKWEFAGSSHLSKVVCPHPQNQSSAAPEGRWKKTQVVGPG